MTYFECSIITRKKILFFWLQVSIGKMRNKNERVHFYQLRKDLQKMIFKKKNEFTKAVVNIKIKIISFTSTLRTVKNQFLIDFHGFWNVILWAKRKIAVCNTLVIVIFYFISFFVCTPRYVIFEYCVAHAKSVFGRHLVSEGFRVQFIFLNCWRGNCFMIISPR